MSNCPKCSASLRPEMKFCPSCGSKNGVPESVVASNDLDQARIDRALGKEETHQPKSASSQPIRTDPKQNLSDLKSNSLTNKQKVSLVIFSVLIIVGFFVVAVTNSANEVAEQERMAKRAELVATACVNLIDDHVSDVSQAEVIRHITSSEKVVVNFLNSNGSQLGMDAHCGYSVSGNTITLESISWSRKIDGRETEITYDRSTGLIDFAKEPIESEPSKAGGSSSLTCEQAFRLAASVPLSQDNNAEIAETTRACSGVDEWWEMLKRYPDAFGVTYFLESEKGLYVGSACLVGQGSPVCTEADLLGIGF